MSDLFAVAVPGQDGSTDVELFTEAGDVLVCDDAQLLFAAFPEGFVVRVPNNLEPVRDFTSWITDSSIQFKPQRHEE
ncbi:hypothetical protein GCM10017691_24030 [Pseudonocardia petroleophila]|uniref:Uncharacterized protein n=1 Tax=Pseudonocardia petroleophila TaxID=37331 RepID=A0A7G7MFU0_9PSEU|nr:hypothetical protein [Pseudonocardia petroleophila]QNG51651.1 hypothetical protein H6H00_26685 [Pseudonocardia petroleophila]